MSRNIGTLMEQTWKHKSFRYHHSVFVNCWLLYNGWSNMMHIWALCCLVKGKAQKYNVHLTWCTVILGHFLPIIAAYDDGLSTGAAWGHRKLVFLLISTVVKLLHDAALLSVGHQPLVTARGHDGIAGPGQRIWRTGMHADFTLEEKNIWKIA